MLQTHSVQFAQLLLEIVLYASWPLVAPLRHYLTLDCCSVKIMGWMLPFLSMSLPKRVLLASANGQEQQRELARQDTKTKESGKIRWNRCWTNCFHIRRNNTTIRFKSMVTSG